jgi:hypothetical protein
LAAVWEGSGGMGKKKGKKKEKQRKRGREEERVSAEAVYTGFADGITDRMFFR